MVNYMVQLNRKRSQIWLKKTNAEISPSVLILKDELNKIGLFNVELNFHTEVKASVSIKIDKVQSK